MRQKLRIYIRSNKIIERNILNFFLNLMRNLCFLLLEHLKVMPSVENSQIMLSTAIHKILDEVSYQELRSLIWVIMVRNQLSLIRGKFWAQNSHKHSLEIICANVSSSCVIFSLHFFFYYYLVLLKIFCNYQKEMVENLSVIIRANFKYSLFYFIDWHRSSWFLLSSFENCLDLKELFLNISIIWQNIKCLE